MFVKVLHISISDGRGGASIAAYRLHNAMNETNFLSSQMLVLVKNTIYNHTVTLPFLQIQIARISNLINNFFGRSKKQIGLFSFGLLGSQFKNSRLVQEADVIYFHWVNNGMMSWNSLDKIFLLNKPIFLFGHDMWYFSGGCHQSNGCQKYQIGCDECPYFENKMLKRLVKNNFDKKKLSYVNNTNVVQIFPSSDFYNRALSSDIIDKKRVKFISNILDTDKFIPTKLVRKKIRLKVLYGAMGGKTNPYKGWEDFVYFASQIAEKYKESIEICLFGYDFQISELDNLPFHAKSYGVIHIEEEIIKMYQDVDVFVFPSSQESFGQTLIEAMSCGVIPIAYKVGIAPDVIENGISGFVIEVGDRVNLVNAFHTLVGMDINQLKYNVRKSIDNNFSKEFLINKHIELIKASL